MRDENVEFDEVLHAAELTIATSTPTPFYSVPDVVGVVLSYLPPKQHGKCREVSRWWNLAVESIAAETEMLETDIDLCGRWRNRKVVAFCEPHLVDRFTPDILFVKFLADVGITVLLALFVMSPLTKDLGQLDTIALSLVLAVTMVVFIGGIFSGRFRHVTLMFGSAVLLVAFFSLGAVICESFYDEAVDIAAQTGGVMVPECQSTSPRSLLTHWKPSEIAFHHPASWSFYHHTFAIKGEGDNNEEIFYFSVLRSNKTIRQLGVTCSAVVTNYDPTNQTWDDFLDYPPKDIAIGALTFNWPPVSNGGEDHVGTTVPLRFAGVRVNKYAWNTMDLDVALAWRNSALEWLHNGTVLFPMQFQFDLQHFERLVVSLRSVYLGFATLTYLALAVQWLLWVLPLRWYYWRRRSLVIVPGEDTTWTRRVLKQPPPSLTEVYVFVASRS